MATFLVPVLRGSWPCVVAVLCGSYVDSVRWDQTCFFGPALVGALAFSAVGSIGTIRHIVRDRRAATLVSTGVNVYAIAVTWALITV